MTVRIRLNTRVLRKKRHLTQLQMAQKANLSKTTISNLESGKQAKIELDTIGKLCEALECTPNDIFEFESTFEESLVRKQKKALSYFIGSLKYDKAFNPKDLDEDLAKKDKEMIFVDTSAWIYLFDQRRGGHEAALAAEFYHSNKKSLAITDLILEETHKWLIHHAFPKEKAFKILKEFVNENFSKIIAIENSDRINASHVLHKYLDQGLSYTDAITVSVMKRIKVKEVFSFDTHFDLFPTIVRVPHSYGT